MASLRRRFGRQALTGRGVESEPESSLLSYKSLILASLLVEDDSPKYQHVSTFLIVSLTRLICESMKTFQELKLGDSDKFTLLEACFDWSQVDVPPGGQVLDEFLGVYFEQLQQLDLEYGKGGEKWIFAEKSHRQLSGTITALRNAGLSTTRVEARVAVRDHFSLLTPDLQALDSPIDVALRIWLSINFRSVDDISIGFGRPCVLWPEKASLQSILTGTFQRSTTELTLAQRRLSPEFTVANMVNICGLCVRWANTLDDHLYLDRQLKILWISPLRSWLNLQSKEQGAQVPLTSSQTQSRAARAPLNQAVYDEANRTMDLLFLSWDRKTQRFLKGQQKEQMAFHSRLRELDLKRYTFWRDRLIELNEDIFLAPPEGWVQLWNDRRDPQKFWTFWIALIILWLTILSTVAAVLQTWATLRGS